MRKPHSPPAAEITEILRDAADDISSLSGESVLVTGGTGFVGTWLVTALVEAKRHMGLDIDITVISRSPGRFSSRTPAVAGAVRLISGDVRKLPTIPAFTSVIHAATPAVATLNDTDPNLMRAINIEGMAQVLEACDSANRPRLLFTSSGAVYGPQPLDLPGMPEFHVPALDVELSPYAQGKREAEMLATAAHQQGLVDLRLARLFAFAGPLLPLDGSFAVGNFVRDALLRDRIVVEGDGSAVRSYLYPTDMVRALLAIMSRGEGARPYNVGSERDLSIRELAERVRAVVNPACRVDIRGADRESLPTSAGSRYVPDCSRIETELGFEPMIDLDRALARYARWAAG